MRITDLLKACSVELNGTPQTKEETIKQMVALMEKGGNVTDVEKYTNLLPVFDRDYKVVLKNIKQGSLPVRKKERRESGKELQSLMQRPMQLMHRGLQQW